MQCEKQRGFEIVSRFETIPSLPKRSTYGSAGYDFYSPERIVIPSHLLLWNQIIQEGHASGKPYPKPYCIKTGVKAFMQDDEVLQLYIRSSSPSKLGLVMANSVGIVDSDYYNNSDNEGEIGFLVYNLTQSDVIIQKGDKIGQGIFTKFLKAFDDTIDESYERVGGYGSTGK